MGAWELNFVTISKAVRFTENFIHFRMKMTHGDWWFKYSYIYTDKYVQNCKWPCSTRKEKIGKSRWNQII